MTDATIRTGSLGSTGAPAGSGQLRRDVRLSGLTMISLGSIIGSGWLLGALNAAKIAGPASLLSWSLGGAVLAVLALVHAELGTAYPVSGGTARFPYLSFGALGGFAGGWFAWLQAVTIAPIEVEATLTYISSSTAVENDILKPLHLTVLVNANGTLSGGGILVGVILMLIFSAVNVLGVRWLAETNTVATIWKTIIPTITFIALLAVSFHGHNFSAGGGFFEAGGHGLFQALPLGGIVFALEGFEQAVQVGGEARNPQRDIPRAVIGAMIIGTLIYLLLEVAFVGALNPADIAHNWSAPIAGVGSFGPYATLASRAGLGWLAVLLYIDAVISPAGTGLVYVGTSSRLSYGLGRNRYFPQVISKVDRRGVPFASILISFVIGCLTFLPFPSWAGLVGLVTSATVLMYGMAPVALGALRSRDPDRPRVFRLPAAHVLCPLSFILANFIVYWSGWSTVFWLYCGLAIGALLFLASQLARPAAERTIIDWRAASWIVPWLAGLAVISWQGQYNGVPPTVFGVTLLATGRIHLWVDLGILAAFSLAIYYWALFVAMSQDKVAAAVREVSEEAELGLVAA